MAESRLYSIWRNMKNRCYNPSVDSYADYGARGIKVCPEWQEFIPFMRWAYGNGFKESKNSRGYSLDRIDTNGDYCPENRKWSTSIEQANNKRNNHVLEYNGQKKTIAEWSREFDIPYGVLSQRIYRGWTIERALETPVGDDIWHK